MQRELPIFPLRVVLFPGAILPLHIFEPRYRQLLGDCLAQDERFGVSFSETPAPGKWSVGCRAHIRHVEELPDGRSDIVVRGDRRYRILEWLERGKPYLVARVEDVDDGPESSDDLGQLQHEARGEFERLTSLLSNLASTESPVVNLVTDPTDFSFQVSAALDLDPETKQALLAETSTVARLKEIIIRIRAIRERIKSEVTLQTVARRNGKSRHPPQLNRSS